MSAQLQGAPLTRQQRAYHVHQAASAASRRAFEAKLAARRELDRMIDGRGRAMLPLHELERLVHTANIWAGITRACCREELRLAKLKHGGAR